MTNSSHALLHLIREIYGRDDEDFFKHKLNRLTAQCALFERYYGGGTVKLLRAPARINILGEHVDYVSYLPTASLPFGSREHDMIMLYRANGTNRVRGASTSNHFAAAEFDLTAVVPSGTTENFRADWQDYLFNKPTDSPHWINYVKGAVYYARFKYGARLVQGFDFLIDSSIPPGGGSSSSSALTVLASAAARIVNNIECDARELAFDSASAEWYVGTRGGAMDHLTICLAKRHYAVHLDYASEQTALVEVPDEEYCWVTFFSHAADKGREVMLEYNERAAVARVIIPALIYDWQKAVSFDGLQQVINGLPDSITLVEIEQRYPEAFHECARAFPALASQRYDQSFKVRDRASHHLGESRRVAAAVKILRNVSANQSASGVESGMSALGELLNQSHESLRDLYSICTSEVNELIRVIERGLEVYGARLMGAGFGGNVLALTKRESASSLIDRVQTEYYKPRSRDGIAEGSILVSTLGDGLSSLELDSFQTGK
ncbi:MAG TPA: galactokinase family protein [Blastocatellia bacterium]|nr:galactokinase family protein [Blastocatellia bacterium]